MILKQAESRLVGYARVSTSEQELSLQIDALLQHGVKKEHLFCDKISGAKEERPGLTACNNEMLRGAIRWSFGDWTGWGVRCVTWST